jgi:hypothetical protein
MSESEDFVNVTWHTTLEDYFAATGERAQCLAWCHKRAEELYSHRRTFIDLPVIVLSGVTGFCSVGSQNIFGPNNQQLSSITLGAASLVVSILNTVGSYFAWAKRAEGHRISSIQYSRLYRMLMVEMNLPRDERRTPAALLKDVKDQYDRLQEISPLLPPEIVNVFRKKFDQQTDISKPEETNGLENISVYPVDPMTIATPSQKPIHVQQATAFQLPTPRPGPPPPKDKPAPKDETSVEIFTTE